MDATRFLNISTAAVTEFLKKEFSQRSELPRVEFLEGFPKNQTELEEQTESRRGFFSSLSDRTPIHAFLSPYAVTRTQSERTQERESATIAEDSGRRTVVSKRGPELYRIKYMIMGPSFSTSEGQNLTSALISVFFDARNIEIDIDGNRETIQLEEPIQASDIELDRFLASTQITRRPLYLFTASTQIASGRAIESSRVVESRTISFRSNFSKSLNPNPGGDPNL